MQFLTQDMILRLVLYPAALVGAIASCWLILRPLLSRGTQNAQVEAVKLAEQSMTSQHITERLKNRLS
jgi:hypothetical protein